MPRSCSSQTAIDPSLELVHPPSSGEPAPVSFAPDETDYAHRAFVNLLATAALLLIALAIVWTVREIEAQEKLRICLDTGQRECVQLVPPRPGVRMLSH